MQASGQRRCPGCKEVKPRINTFWNRESRRPDGLSPYCKLCDRAKVKARSQRHKAVNEQNTVDDDFEITVDDPQVEAAFEATKPDLVVSAKLQSVKARRYVITAAQNATPLHLPFWQSLQTYARELNAQILVVPLRYKNPTSIWQQQDQDDDWWAPELAEYLIDARKSLHKHLVLCADVKTQPTASDPLSGFQSLTGPESCIIGHTKMAFEPVPTSPGSYPKILTTTGACTLPNFTNTKTGKVGEFHHYLGAIVVEDDGGLFHIRQLNADRENGSFIDLARGVMKVYGSTGSIEAERALGLQPGDTHARFADEGVDEATFGPEGILKVTRARKIIWNDLLDGYAVNPHHLGNLFITLGKTKAHFGNVKEEVVHAVDFVRQRTPVDTESYIIPSNHDDFLARWVIRTLNQGCHDPVNLRFFLQTALAMTESVTMTPSGTKYADPFQHWVGQLTTKEDHITYLNRGESLVIGDAECGLHGDKGPNGAKGTMRNLSRLGTKVNSNHRHAPGIREGHYGAGTSTPLELEYTIGAPSGWLQTHIVTYANKARALITVIGKRWRLED